MQPPPENTLCADEGTTGMPSVEDGAALVTVLLASLIIAGIVTVMLMSSLVELRSTGAASAYEAAVHTAEAAIEQRFATMLSEPPAAPAYTWNPAVVPFEVDQATERAEVLRIVQEHRDDLEPIAQNHATGYAIGPIEAADGRAYVYGVAEIHEARSTERVRIVRVQVARDGTVPPPSPPPGGGGQPPPTGPLSDQAVLINGSLRIDGNVHNLAGSIHTNGDLLMRDYIFESNADLRANTGPWSATGEATCVDPNDYWGGCYRARNLEEARPELAPLLRSEQPEVSVPMLTARDLHAAWAYQIREHWFDLCYPGAVAAHPTHATVVQPTSPEDGPCEGEVIFVITGSWPNDHYQGWQYEAPERQFTRSWGGMPDDGVYYVHERNVNTNALGSSTKRVTVVASADPNDPDGANSGNIFWRGNSHYLYFENDDGFQVAAFADRDIDARSGTHIAEGVVYAREQIRFGGFTRVTGQVIAAGASMNDPGVPDTPGSPVSGHLGAESWTGSLYLIYAPYSLAVEPGEGEPTVPPDPGGNGTPTLHGSITVLSWQEL